MVFIIYLCNNANSILQTTLWPQERIRLLKIRIPIPAPRHLKIKLRSRPIVISNFIHRRSVVHPAVEDGVAYRFAVADVVQRVFVQHDEVGQFAGFDAAELVAHTEVNGTVDGRTF